MKKIFISLVFLAFFMTLDFNAYGCDCEPSPNDRRDCSQSSFGDLVPLNELTTSTYYGWEGGLYPGAVNELPDITDPGSSDPLQIHANEGLRLAKTIAPLSVDEEGIAFVDYDDGKIVVMSIGYSNTTMHFCGTHFNKCEISFSGTSPGGCYDPEQNDTCLLGSFADLSMNDPLTNSRYLVFWDGARSSATAALWADPFDSSNDRNCDITCVDTNEPYLGFNIYDYNCSCPKIYGSLQAFENQVQIVYMQAAAFGNATIADYPDDPNAKPYVQVGFSGEIARALKVRYPNLKMIFITDGTYGGYGIHPQSTNPMEPASYENSFTTKWFVESQIQQMAGVLPEDLDFPLNLAGDLHYDGANPAAPWIAWGPHFWANGSTARENPDDITWECANEHPQFPAISDVIAVDGVHLTCAGIEKLGSTILDHFLNSQFTKPWFTNDGDEDGMPYEWEIQYGLDTATNDANSDNDGDGRSNFEEYEQGTDPIIYDNNCTNLPIQKGESGAYVYYSLLQGLYDSYDGGDVKAQATTFPEDLYLDQDRSIIMQGGYDCNYTNSTGKTVIKGNLSFTSGSIEFNNGKFAFE